MILYKVFQKLNFVSSVGVFFFPPAQSAYNFDTFADRNAGKI